jgi:hypothetical protein
VQLEAFERPKAIFSEYAYFSSYSSSWWSIAAERRSHGDPRFGLTAREPRVEVASNDGYLLQYFRCAAACTLGFEPAANIAGVARAKESGPWSNSSGADSAHRLVADHGAA